eukprot:125837_1
MQTSMLSLNEFAEKHPCVGMFDIPSGTLASYLSSLGSLDTIDGSDENKTAISSTNNQGLTCCACGLTFPSREEQGNHFRSDTHRIRLKIMLGWEGGTGKNLEMVKENEDGDEQESDSSSHDDEESEIGGGLGIHAVEETKGGVLKVSGTRGKVMAWKCKKRGWVLTIAPSNSNVPPLVHITMNLSALPQSKGEDELSVADDLWGRAIGLLEATSQGSRMWAVLLLRSGRFAGAVFDGSETIAHKSFTRYTVRAKRGGSQSSYDSGGNRPQSAGAMLRRAGEEKLKEEVRGLLSKWDDFLNMCEAIVVSVPKTMQSILFGSSGTKKGEKIILDKSDSRIRHCSVQRPTFSEAVAIHSAMTLLELDPPLKSQICLREKLKLPASSSRPRNVVTPAKAKIQNHQVLPRGPLKQIVEEETPVAPEVVALHKACAMGDVDAVHSMLHNNTASLVNEPSSMSTLLTPLHVACEHGDTALIEILLDAGADPTLTDIRNRAPYFLITSKRAREAFRRFRAKAEDQWDWEAARVPSGLTDDKLDILREKEREKRRRAKERRKENKMKGRAEAEAEEKEKQAEEEERLKKDQCSSCKKPIIDDRKPLHLFDKKVCSSKCAQELRRHLQAEAAEKRMLSLT